MGGEIAVTKALNQDEGHRVMQTGATRNMWRVGDEQQQTVYKLDAITHGLNVTVSVGGQGLKLVKVIILNITTCTRHHWGNILFMCLCHNVFNAMCS